MCSENINGLVQYYIYIPIGIIITDDALETRHPCTKSAAMYATQKHTRHGVMTWKHFLHHLPLASLHKRSIMRTCDVKVAVSLNKLLNKQSGCRLFEAPWRSYDVTSNRYLIIIFHWPCWQAYGLKPEPWWPCSQSKHLSTQISKLSIASQSFTKYGTQHNLMHPILQVFVNIFA